MNISRIGRTLSFPALQMLAFFFFVLGTACLIMIMRYDNLVLPFDLYWPTYNLPSRLNAWTYATVAVVSYAIAGASAWFASSRRERY